MSDLDWTDDGQPRSQRFGDIYFSAENGLAESRAVFLDGCGLPEAWRGRDRFVVGELGFGTGLNVLALAELWLDTTKPPALLHIFSIEGFPLRAEEAARAWGAFPELAGVEGATAGRWPGVARGFHRRIWGGGRVVLDVGVMGVMEALEAWGGRADAWFLDGFSPALNPDMWTPQVMSLVAQRSAAGARAATFTVAGEVRRGLQAAGFAVEKKPGFGRKRERLEARLPGTAPPTPTRSVVIIGAGIAGASAARAVRALGVEPIILDAVGPGAGGSGNPAALVTPRLDAGLGPVAQLAAQTFRRAVDLYGELPAAILARGVLQLAQDEQDWGRFMRIAASDLFEPQSLTLLDEDAVARRLEIKGRRGLDLADALVVEPAQVLQAWGGAVTQGTADRLEPDGEGWRVLDAEGALLAQAAVVIVAAGLSTLGLETVLSPVRGQASWVRGVPVHQAASFGGYAAPTRDGMLFGATHDREDRGIETRAGDHARNLEQLAQTLPNLAARIDGLPLEGRAALRASTPDFLPLAGQVKPGVFLLTGFGSRGFCFAPLLAEHVAALSQGTPSPLPNVLAELVDPGRFARRAARRLGRN